MSQNKNPLGLHIQRYASPNDDWIKDHVAQADYMTCTSLDASGMASDLQERGVPYSIVRFYEFEPSPHGLTQSEDIKKFAERQYETVSSWARVTQNPSIHAYVNNEQGHSWQRLMMYRFMMDAAMADPLGPVGMVFLNAAPGTIRHGFWGEPNDFAADEFMKFLLTLDKYRNVRLPSGAYAFLLGIHNYTSQYAWIAVNAGRHRTPSWDIAAKFDEDELWVDWSLSQDHLGREYQGIRHALGWKWDNSARKWYATNGIQKRADGTPVEPPWMLVTECLFDNMQDVRNVHPDLIVDDVHEPGTSAELNPRGYHTLATMWRKWFGDKPAGYTLARMLKWTWQHIYAPEGYFVGFNYFSFGNTGGHISYTNTPDAVADPDYFHEVTRFRAPIPDHFFHKETLPMPNEPVPVPTPQPKPSTLLSWLVVGGLALSIVLVLFLVLFRSVGGATAQAAEEIVITAPVTLEQLVTVFVTTIFWFLLSNAEAPITTVIVNFFKAVFQFAPWEWLRNLPAKWIVVGISGLVTIVGLAATRFGFDGQLNNLFEWLMITLPPLTNFITVIAGSMGFYKLFNAMGLPLFGYQRTP